MRLCTTLVLLVSFVGLACPAAKAAPARQQFLENASLRIGIDLGSGGGVFFFSERATRKNLLNHKDKGRLIQQSYYGGEDGTKWAGQPWRWNPVQGGDSRDTASKILDFANDGTRLYVKTAPRHWSGLKPLPEVVMEQTITLQDQIARIDFVVTYTGTERHPAHHQELPAVFIDAALPILRFYDGDKPWTGAPLRQAEPGFPNEYFKITENWAAYTNRQGWGMGVYVPGVRDITAYRHVGAGGRGPQADACSYFAPIRTFAFDRPFRFEYTVWLAIGKVEDMRAKFAELRTVAKPGRFSTP